MHTLYLSLIYYFTNHTHKHSELLRVYKLSPTHLYVAHCHFPQLHKFLYGILYCILYFNMYFHFFFLVCCTYFISLFQYFCTFMLIFFSILVLFLWYCTCPCFSHPVSCWNYEFLFEMNKVSSLSLTVSICSVRIR